MSTKEETIRKDGFFFWHYSAAFKQVTSGEQPLRLLTGPSLATVVDSIGKAVPYVDKTVTVLYVNDFIIVRRLDSSTFEK